MPYVLQSLSYSIGFGRQKPESSIYKEEVCILLSVLYVIGTSQYQSTVIFMREMAEEMKQCGYEVTVLDVNDETEYQEQREEVFCKEYDVIFTINGMILEKDSALGARLLKNQDTLYCTYLMDHPMIHMERLKSVYPRILILSPDRKHAEFVDTYMEHIWCAGFLPHGGCTCHVVKDYQDRSIDISFMGSYSSPKKIWDGFARYPEAMCSLMQAVAKSLEGQPQQTMEEALQKELDARGIVASKEEFMDMMGEFRDVDRYIRSYYRDLVIRTLAESGITVDVYGDGWEEFETVGREHIRIHPAVSYQDSLDIIGNSRISLNIMPWFKDGSHDRVFTAMLNGAICLTDGSEYLQEIGKEEENIYFYSLKGLRYLPSKVKRILSDERKAEKVAMAGKELAEQYHTWKNRAWEVMDYWEQLTQNNDAGQEVTSERQALEEFIYKNAALIQTANQAVRHIRRQEYLYAMRKVTKSIDMLSELLPECMKWQEYFNQQEILIDFTGINAMLGDILIAQQQSNYVWLADLLELCLIPFAVSLQEYYGRTQEAAQTGIPGYELEHTSCGLYTLAVCQGENKVYLHTNGNVLKEAEVLAESWFEKDTFHYTVYGLGLGYHIQALLDIDETVTVTVLEADGNIIQLAKQYGVRGLWEEDRVRVVHDAEFTHLLELASKQSKEDAFVIHYPSMSVIENTFYKKQLEDYFIQYSSAKTQATRLIGNFIKNREGFHHEVSELKEKFAGKTLYIIAAGPSLDTNMTELKQVGEDGIILATGTVLKKLLKAGIKPDYAIIIDGGSFTHGQVCGVEDCQVPLLYMSTVYYKIPAQYQGEKYVIFQKDFSYSEKYASEKGYPLFQSGGSVTTTALDIGICFGCEKIVFVGLDLAYTNDKDHASDTAITRTIEQGNDPMVEDISGNMVRTAKNLDLYRRWIEERIKTENTVQFIDATEGGAKINGTAIKKLSEVIGSKKSHPQEDKKIAKTSVVSDCGDTGFVRNRVVLLWKESKYDIQKYIMDTFEKYLSDKGYRVAKISLSVKNPYSNFDRALGDEKKDVCLVFSMDAIGFEIQTFNDERWVNGMACPCITYFYHHPMRYYDVLLKEFGWNVGIHSGDTRYLCGVTKYFPTLEDTLLINGLGFSGKNIRDYKERSHDVYFPAGYIPASRCRQQIEAMPEVFFNLAKDILQRMKRDNTLSLEKALEACLLDMQFSCSVIEFCSIFQMMQEVENYIKMERIEKVVGTLLSNEIKVTVSGTGWEDFSHKNIHFLQIAGGRDGLSFEAMLDVMGDAKIVLDMHDNGQEDISTVMISAMKNGAVCLTDAHKVKEQFSVDEEILYYEESVLDKMGSQIRDYLQEDSLAQIALKGKEKADTYMNPEEYIDMLLHLED